MEQIRILVIDNQVISPVESGAPIRIFNLFGKLPKKYDVHYIGVSGWKHLGKGIKNLSQNFKEEIIPLGNSFICADNLFSNIIKSIRSFDVLCSYLMFLNPKFMKRLNEEVKKADIVIASHPWFFSYLKNCKNKIKIYDSHNCEYLLYKKFLEGSVSKKVFSSLIKKIEKDACLYSDIILACSSKDQENFVRLYNAKRDKIFLVPNPIDTASVLPIDEKEMAKKDLDVKGKTIVFIGTYYLPNIEAFQFIMKELVPNMKDHTFLMVGSVENSFLESVDEYLKDVPIEKIKIENKGILGYGYFNLEKWSNPPFNVRWTKKEFSLVIKDKAITKIEFGLRSLKKINCELFVNNEKIKSIKLKTGNEFEKFNFSFEKRDNINCVFKLDKLNKSIIRDTRDIGIAIRGINYVSNGKIKKISLEKTIAPLLIPKNVRLYGKVSNEKLKQIYKAADIAINPMFSGSGLNIKMLDYMAAGLPVISTEVGARGLKIENDKELIICKSDQFKEKIEFLFDNVELYEQLRKNARKIVEKKYDSKIITKKLDKLLNNFVNMIIFTINFF
ncbi:hypothetical protein CL621_01595 [archaeon]|nr:hypothetical protein [archaeon]